MKNRLVIEGHSDARPLRNAAPASGYGNWELSADRANAARRLVSGSGAGAAQVAEVRGFADQIPWNAADPGRSGSLAGTALTRHLTRQAGNPNAALAATLNTPPILSSAISTGLK
jgi:hypothetical protein